MSPIDNKLLVPRQEPLLLDYAPGAAAAYSLRKLSLSYTGPVVTVRRSSDDAEASFTAAEIDDGTLLGWVGAGVSGYVTTWHDQSGEGNDATQTTAGYQPRIVDAGVLETEGGKAALLFDGSDDRLTVASSTATFKFLHDGTKSAVFSIAKFGESANPDDIYAFIGNNAGGTANVGILYAFDDRVSVSANNRLYVFVGRGVAGQTVVFFEADDALAPQELHVTTVLLDASNATTALRVSSYVDGANIDTANTGTHAPSAASATFDMQLGANGNNGAFMLGTISELIIYPSDMTAQRQRIEGDMAWYY